MSVTISTPDAILKSPSNNSPSKLQYTFSKSRRFSNSPKNDFHIQQWDLPSTQSPRHAGFGYGEKSDFTKGTEDSVSPDRYNPKNDYESQRPKSSMYSFGLSRESLGRKRVIKGDPQQDRDVPGPGVYNTIRSPGADMPRFSFRPRTKGGVEFKNRNPPPDAYQVRTDPARTSSLSKFKRVLSPCMSPKQASRFKDASRTLKNEPGPSTYHPRIQNQSNPGVYSVSKYRSVATRNFGKDARVLYKHKEANATPGPGSYQLPSDFGHYVSSKAMRDGKNNKDSYSTTASTLKPNRRSMPDLLKVQSYFKMGNCFAGGKDEKEKTFKKV